MGKRRRLNIVNREEENSSHVATSNNEKPQSTTNSATNQVQESNGEANESGESHSISSTTKVADDVVPKATRGPTRMFEVWDMDDTEVISVRLDASGRPVGQEASSITRFIGSLERRHQYAPINYTSWKLMPKKYKEDMLKIVESKYVFSPPINEQLRVWLNVQMSEKWRQWKGYLKKDVDFSKTEEEIASRIPDDRAEPSQYRELVHHWFLDEGQKISTINKNNRAKFEDTHCMGTKSLPVMIDENKKKNKGVLPERHLVYIDTRTRKDGTIVNKKTVGVIEEIKKHMHEGETSQTSQNTQSDTYWKNDLFSKVLGPEKRGYLRCVGKIPKTKKSKASSSEDADLREEFKQVKGILTNVLRLIQNRLPREDVQDILQIAAEQVPDASSVPNDQGHSNSVNKDNEYSEI